MVTVKTKIGLLPVEALKIQECREKIPCGKGVYKIYRYQGRIVKQDYKVIVDSSKLIMVGKVRFAQTRFLMAEWWKAFIALFKS